MSNFYNDNPDLLFTLKNLELEEVVKLKEKDYTEAKKFDYAPENYEDAIDSYDKVLRHRRCHRRKNCPPFQTGGRGRTAL